MSFDVFIMPLTKWLNVLQGKHCLIHHLSQLISLPTLLFKTETKEYNSFARLEHKDIVTEQKVSKLEVFQNLKQSLNLNKYINIIVQAVFHRCRGYFFKYTYL